MGHMDHYENDFEVAMLKDTSAYYSRKASNWILEDSCPDYMLKVLFLRGFFISNIIWLLFNIVSFITGGGVLETGERQGC